MSLSESLFGLGHKFARRLWGSGAHHGPRVEFDSVQNELRIFAALLFGREARVQASDDAGGCSLLHIETPTAMPSRELYLFRLVHAAAFHSLCSTSHLALLKDLDETERKLTSLFCVTAIQAHADSLFPSLASLRSRAYNDAALAAPPRPGICGTLEARLLGLLPHGDEDAFSQRLLSQTFDLKSAVEAARSLRRQRPLGAAHLLPWGKLLAPAPPDPSATVSSAVYDEDALSRGAELRAKVLSDFKRLEAPPKEQAQNPIFHALESVQTAEDYSGGNKPLDGSDEAADHQTAVEELTLSTIIRSNERTQTVLKSNVMIEGAAPELADDHEVSGKVHDYSEWDDQRRRYRVGHCRLRSLAGDEASAEQLAGFLERQVVHRHKIEELRRKLLILKSERRVQNACAEGAEIDLDAMVDRHAALAAGSTPTDRFYCDPRKTSRDVAVLILLDSSLSTDGWVQNHRVLDVETSSVFILGQVLSSLDVAVSVASFHSHTRRDCRFLNLKTFDQDWSGTASRLAALRPTAYSRIGPALRHATTVLQACGQRRRYLLVVTDAKPTDYDHYEGRYGIADVRQAVREAKNAGISTHALAIDKSAGPFLGKMFPRHFLVPHPRLLSDALVGIFAEMKAR